MIQKEHDPCKGGTTYQSKQINPSTLNQFGPALQAYNSSDAGSTRACSPGFQPCMSGSVGYSSRTVLSYTRAGGCSLILTASLGKLIFMLASSRLALVLAFFALSAWGTEAAVSGAATSSELPFSAASASAASGSVPVFFTSLNPFTDFNTGVQSTRIRNYPSSEFIITLWQDSDELPINVVNDIRQTADSYLWLSTPQGLVRFDGVQFQGVSGPTGVRAKPRGPLECDARGRLWFAADEQNLGCIQGGRIIMAATKAAPGESIANLCLGNGTEMMWAGRNGTLGMNLTVPPFESKPLFSGPKDSRWIRDYKGNLWLVRPHKVKIYQSGQLRDVEVSGAGTLVAAPRRAGGLWIARDGQLQFVLDNGTNQILVHFAWNNLSRVSCMFEDHKNRLWIGTDSQGLFCVNGGEVKQIVPIANRISSLFEDARNDIWIGTRGGGLIRAKEREFFTWELGNGYGNELVRSVVPGEDGRVWAVSADGDLGWSENGVWRWAGQGDGWPGFKALSICPAKGGGVWIATEKAGIWRWRDGEFRQRALQSSEPVGPAISMLEDRGGRLWFLSKEVGIYCVEDGRLLHYTTKDGLPDAHFRLLAEDESGGLWAGDWKGGVARFQGERWKVVRTSNDYTNAIQSMIIWKGAPLVGSSAGGLLWLKDGKAKVIGGEQGLLNTSIQHLLLDGRDSLWGTMSHRLFKISLRQLDAVLNGREQKVNPVIYGQNDGIPYDFFANRSDPSCMRTENGELWFATTKGAIHFRPADLNGGNAPAALIDQILVNGSPVLATELRHLRPASGRLEFHFTAPCMAGAHRIRFRYRMTNVDHDWIDAGTARSATYAAIPDGEHKFSVLASSPDGLWSEQPATVMLNVRPYFWQTTPFLVMMTTLCAGGGGWLFRRYSVRRLKRRLYELHQRHQLEQERMRIAQDLHDELGANLTSIGLLADLGTRHQSKPAMLGRDLEQISKTARESVMSLDAIVWALNPHKDSLEHFVSYIAQFTRDFFRPTQIRTRLELPESLPEQSLDTEKRHDLFLLIKELFNNVVRHAEATEVHLRLAYEKNCLYLSVSDNGKGLAAAAAGGESQDGLVNLRRRIEALGGSLCIGTPKGGGSRFDFTLPMHKRSRN